MLLVLSSNSLQNFLKSLFHEHAIASDYAGRFTGIRVNNSSNMALQNCYLSIHFDGLLLAKLNDSYVSGTGRGEVLLRAVKYTWLNKL